jgi:ferredoxin, 2Fe-2S
MTQIVILPHSEYCPDGAVLEVSPGTSICEALLENDIPIEHACDMVCACTTCHVIVREGFNSLNEPDENEEDLLDRAWGLIPYRACRARPLLRKTTSWLRYQNTRSTTPKKIINCP